MRADVFHYAAEIVEGAGGLRIQAYGAAEVELACVFNVFHYYSVAVGLAYEAEHFGVPPFSEYYNLLVTRSFVFQGYALL